MKEVTDLRQLTTGNIVLMVAFDHSNFDSNDPEGWYSEVCWVPCIMSPYFTPEAPSIELLPVRTRGNEVDTYYIYQNLNHIVDPVKGPLFINDFGMGGASECKLFLLSHTEEIVMSPDTDHWTDVPACAELKTRWSVG